jgi:hypothetical protein
METNGAVRRITTQDAKIKTATVELKALVIDGKQVTLSVFRQFQNEDLIDLESGQLKGVPWGRVNYDPGDCIANEKHLHVVWQKGSELRRACVREEFCVPNELWIKKSLARGRYLAQAALDGAITEFPEDYDSCFVADEKLRVALGGYLGSLHKERSLRLHHPLGKIEQKIHEYMQGHENELKKHREQLERYAAAYPYREGSIEHAQRLIAEFKNNWSESYTAVASIEQIFIAV